MKPTSPKTSSEVSQEWDAVAELRHDLIHSGQDPSFENILTPSVIDHLKHTDNSNVLDVGCGTGDLTAMIASKSYKTTAIEPSSQSLKLARVACSRLNVTFFKGTLEEFAKSDGEFSASTIVTAMTLMCVVDIRSFASSLNKVAAPRSSFIATLAHPCFWPRYWGYDSKDWFDYWEEIFIEAQFRTSKASSGVITTHIHRPLEMYIAEFANAGFVLESFSEPKPSPQTESLFPLPWEYPRFLVLKWSKAA